MAVWQYSPYLYSASKTELRSVYRWDFVFCTRHYGRMDLVDEGPLNVTDKLIEFRGETFYWPMFRPLVPLITTAHCDV